MKVEVKTLGGKRFEIEANLEDTVADLKKNIETVQGRDAYPVARQMLIHGCKVLEDDTTLEEIEVLPDDFIVIMLSPLTRVSAPPPPPPSSTTQPPSDAASPDLLPVTEAPPPPAVNPERAESQSPDLPPVTEAPPPPAVNPPEASQPPPAPPTGPNANPLNLFPHDRPAGEPVDGEVDELEQLASAVLALTITREDMEALDRLQAMGFSRALVTEAYFACDKNEEQAAHYLLDRRRYFEED